MAGLRVVFIGPQGSGKGTQAELLSARFSIPAISPGALYRDHIKRGTDVGKKAQEIVSAGDLVGDDLTKQVVQERLAKSDVEHGYILDGYPRNEQQRVDLADITEIDHVFVISISDELAVKRISGRRGCSQGHIYHVTFTPPKEEGVCDIDGEPLTQRDDDTEEAVKKRLAIYHEETQPIIDQYREQDLVHDVDGEQDKDVVQSAIVKFLE